MNRIMQKERLVSLCLLLIAPLVCLGASEKPSIIFFLADDQRDTVLGCYGHPIVKTPTLDRLAAEGVRFENSFCEVYNFGEPAVPAKYIATSYPVMLKAAGYRIGFAGKYGMSFASPGMTKEFDFFKPIERNPYLKRMPDGSLRHETELCGDAAIEFIQSNPPGTPFCLSISFNASHAEDSDHRPGFHFQWPKSTDGMYEDVEIPAPRLGDEKYFTAMPPFLQDITQLNRERFYWRWDTPEKYQINMRAYFRMVTGIDNTIARVLEALRESGMEKNTIIVYTADNGYLMGDRGTAGKWNHYEQSLRVPLIVYDPSLRSLLPLIKGKKGVEWRDTVFCEHKFNRFPNWHGIRGGPYECLYDLENDPDEFTNLAANPEYAPVLGMMRKRLEAYLQKLPETQ